MRKIWNAIVGWLVKLGLDKWLHIFAGLTLCSFFAIALGWKCILPVAIVAGLAKEIFDYFTTKVFDLWDAVATIAGGFIIQAWVWLGLWWLG